MDDPLPFSIETHGDAEHLYFAYPPRRPGILNWPDFHYVNNAKEFVLTAPHGFFARLAGVFAAVPRIRWSNRFSLRTLLITSTLVAVALGLMVYAIRG